MTVTELLFALQVLYKSGEVKGEDEIYITYWKSEDKMVTSDFVIDTDDRPILLHTIDKE